jgi:DNA-directed RNA polymerase specialized sigma54-like protein
MSRIIYYKKLIKTFGLWYSPKMTAKIIREARMYHFAMKSLKSFHWKDIAKDINISVSNMSRIVTGRGFPGKDTMNKLIEYFDLQSNQT